MSLLSEQKSEVDSEIIEGTWRRYSDKMLKGQVLFFTSSVKAANKYKDMSMKRFDDIFKYQVSGRLKLVNVAEYIQGKRW